MAVPPLQDYEHADRLRAAATRLAVSLDESAEGALGYEALLDGAVEELQGCGRHDS
jgi:hypothetical protein